MTQNIMIQNHSQDQFSSENHKLLSKERAQELENQFKKCDPESTCNPELPPGFFFSNEKLMYSSLDDKLPLYICSKLEVVAFIRDENNENYGKLLVFKDPEQQIHKWPMPMELIAGDGIKYRAALLNRGLEISTIRNAQSLLSYYLANVKPSLWIRCIRHLGWHKMNFVLPQEILGSTENEQLIFQNPNIVAPSYNQKGTVKEWIDNVARLCKGNSRLEFAISCAFAPPLLRLLNVEGGGVHMRGTSSMGKSKILEAARSVWGDKMFLQRWNATINGLEAIASGYNDSLLCLDEIAQVDPMIAGEIAYLLSNEKGKLRANKLGLGCEQLHWRLLFLSSGEISLEEHMLQCGKKSKAGQEVRMIDIPADTGKFGCFEELHGFASGEDFADALTVACDNYYGSVSRAYLNAIINNTEAAISFSENVIKAFIEKNKPLKASGQVARALKRFALIAAGGELATEYGLTGWNKGAASEGVSKCFNDWLIDRGGTESQEQIRALRQIRDFFASNSHRFENWDTELSYELAQQASFKKFDRQGNIEFFIHPRLFESEICFGYDPKFIAKLCIEEGLILPSSDKKSTRSETVSINKIKGRFYRFTSKVISA